MNPRFIHLATSHLLGLAGIAALASCGVNQGVPGTVSRAPKPSGRKLPEDARVAVVAGPTAKTTEGSIKPCLAPCGTDGQDFKFDKGWANLKLTWKRPVLKVQFMGGSQKLQDRVIRIARQWSEPSGESFQPVTEGGDIRVAFNPNGGHWSQIGIYATQVSEEDPTMNLEVSDSTSGDELQRVVLHEFGHALGFFHEHLRPDAPIVWNEEAVYASYRGFPNFWSPNEIKEQILAPQPIVDGTVRTNYDPKSIMHYPIPKEFLKKGKPVGWNRELTDYDKRLVSYLYKGKA